MKNTILTEEILEMFMQAEGYKDNLLGKINTRRAIKKDKRYLEELLLNLNEPRNN